MSHGLKVLGLQPTNSSADHDHIPTDIGQTRGLWTREYFLREAAKIGPATGQVIDELIASKPIPAQAYQSCRNVLNMGKHANKIILEKACQRLVDTTGKRRAVTYTAVKNMMAIVRKEAATRPTGPVPPEATFTTPQTATDTPQPSARDTTGAFLGGAAQFSLDNLTKKGTH